MGDTEELAKGYVLLNDAQQEAAKFLISKLKITPGERILDVGCGPGGLTFVLSELVGPDGSVTGIDPSKERIALAHEKTRSNLSFAVGKAENLSLIPDASIDLVFVNSTFHWVRDQVAAIREFARVLRSGGRVGVSGGSGDFVADHDRIREEVLSRAPFNGYSHDDSVPKYVKRREIEDMLDDAGFSSRDIVVNTVVKSAKDEESMMEWLDTSSSGKTYGGIPLELRPKAKEEMKEEWAKLVTEDGIHLKIELLVTVAFKD